MEGAHHQSPAWALRSWDGDTFNEDMWNSIFEGLDANYSAGNFSHFPASDDLVAPQPSAADWDLNDPVVLGLASKSIDYTLDYSLDLDLSEFGPGVVTDITSPISSGSATLTSSPLDFDFNSPTIDMMSHLATTQPSSAYMGEDFGIEVPTIAPRDTVQQSPLQTTAESEVLTMEDRPPGVPAREWRKRIRPEKCPACGKGHTYQAELKKHIAAKHPALAAEHGVSTDRHFCAWCPKSLARRDHLKRHLAKHGRAKKKRKRG